MQYHPEQPLVAWGLLSRATPLSKHRPRSPSRSFDWVRYSLGSYLQPSHLTGHVPAALAHSRNARPLEDLLDVLLEEADPRLPPGFFSIDDSVARRMARPPPRDALIAALREEGFAAARCHLEVS